MKIVWNLRNNRALDYFVLLAIIASILGFIFMFGAKNTHQLSGSARIVDGDSLVISNDQRVRLIGIDAPELRQSCTRQKKPWPCGRLAAQALREAVQDRDISCDAIKRDKHDRWLAICRVKTTDTILNQHMVETGWAVSYYDYPDAERRASKAKRGIWAGEFERPATWRKNNVN